MLDLFESAALARSSDPSTSHEAAASVDAKTLEVEVLLALAHGPQTMHRVASILGRELVSISPRFAPLIRKGLIRVVGCEGRRTTYEAIA